MLTAEDAIRISIEQHLTNITHLISESAVVGLRDTRVSLRDVVGAEVKNDGDIAEYLRELGFGVRMQYDEITEKDYLNISW